MAACAFLPHWILQMQVCGCVVLNTIETPLQQNAKNGGYPLYCMFPVKQSRDTLVNVQRILLQRLQRAGSEGQDGLCPNAGRE